MQGFELISQGCDILDEVLLPHGFNRSDQYEHTEPSITGGGPVVVRGGFERSDRRLEVEVWLDLRRVVYHVGGLWLEHVPYMEALGVVRGTQRVPGILG